MIYTVATRQNIYLIWGHHGRDPMVVDLQLPVHDEVYSIQHYVIEFVSDLWQFSVFLWVLRFPPPIKLTAKI